MLLPQCGASTYQVLSGSEYNKQHSIGGHAAGVLGLKKASAKPTNRYEEQGCRRLTWGCGSAFGKLAPHIDSSASPTLFFKPQDPGGMSTYRVLLIILRTRQYLIGGRAAIEVIAFTKRHVSKETLLVLRNKISASGWYSSGNPVVPP